MVPVKILRGSNSKDLDYWVASDKSHTTGPLGMELRSALVYLKTKQLDRTNIG